MTPTNPQIFPDASPNNRRCIGDAPPKVRQDIACEFSCGTTRSTSAPIATEQVIFIASASPDILVLVGPGQTLRLNSSYLTYAFTMFTHQLYTVTQMKYNIHGDTRTTIKVSVQSEHEPYRLNGVRSIRIHYISYKLHFVPSAPSVLLGTMHEQYAKMEFRYKSRRVSLSSTPFLITMKNGI